MTRPLCATSALLLPLLLVLAVAQGQVFPFKLFNSTSDEAKVALGNGLCTYASLGATKGASGPIPGPTVCPASFGGFHIICGFYHHWEAEGICNQYGWKLAAVNDLNALYAQQTFSDCVSNYMAWIAAFNGINQEPCMAWVARAGVLTSLWAMECKMTLSPVICQEIPSVTETETQTVTMTFNYGTITETTQVTRHPQPRADLEELQKNVLIQDQMEPETVCNSCNVVCPVGDTNLKIVRKRVLYERAALECAKYGWTLADVTSGMQDVLWTAGLTCFPGTFQHNYFVRSYEGVDGAKCLVATVLDANMYVLFGLDAITCNRYSDLPNAYPLCQCDGPLPTGLGPYRGISTTTTTTAYVIEDIFEPATTITITETICQGCKKESSSSSSDSSDSSFLDSSSYED